MRDSYIDSQETQIYGPYTQRQITRLVVGLVPSFDEGMRHLASELEHATTGVKEMLDASTEAKGTLRKGTRAKAPLLKESKALLARFGKHLGGHPKDTVDPKDYFVANGTASGVGDRPTRVLLALSHIATKLAEETCPVRDRETWLADFQSMMSAFNNAVEHSDNAKTSLADTTVEHQAARQAWLETYAAAKCGVECVLRLRGKLHLMPRIFYDLSVPSTTKVVEMPPDPPVDDDSDQ